MTLALAKSFALFLKGMPNRTPTLETQRLILRPVTLADAPDVQRLFGHWEIIRYVGPVPWPYPEDGALTFYRDKHLSAIEEGSTLGWGITDKASGAFMGALDMRLRPESDDTVGFWLGKPFQGRGFMSETVTAVYDYALSVLELPQIVIHNAVANTASHAVQAKSGATLVDVKTAPYPEGELPQERWRLTPEAWRASPMKRAARNPSCQLR